MQEIIKEASDEDEGESSTSTTTEEPTDAWPVDIAKIREVNGCSELTSLRRGSNQVGFWLGNTLEKVYVASN